ncbi:unnamed protein product [Clavelina lepadiformis]|uniref:Uncharacterized protein n=1 Tax=Clavelina lepadiformis TaxID=159417 RepID=A0ABP0EZ58_CLALP
MGIHMRLTGMKSFQSDGKNPDCRGWQEHTRDFFLKGHCTPGQTVSRKKGDTKFCPDFCCKISI